MVGDALAQVGYDLVIGFVGAFIFSALFIAGMAIGRAAYKRQRLLWAAQCEAAAERARLKAIDFAGEIKAYKTSRDIEDAGERRVVR